VFIKSTSLYIQKSQFKDLYICTSEIYYVSTANINEDKFQHLKGAYEKAEEGHFAQACSGRTSRNGFELK